MFDDKTPNGARHNISNRPRAKQLLHINNDLHGRHSHVQPTHQRRQRLRPLHPRRRLPSQHPQQTRPNHRQRPDPSWAITVSGGDTEQIQTNIWYDTAGQNYSDDIGINYDVCAYALSRFPRDTVQLAQDDDSGSCGGVFTPQCIHALTERAAESAHKWVSYSTPPPYQNLTAGVLPSICSYNANDLHDDGMNYPKECKQEFGMSETDGTEGVVTLMQCEHRYLVIDGLESLRLMVCCSSHRLQRLHPEQRSELHTLSSA